MSHLPVFSGDPSPLFAADEQHFHGIDNGVAGSISANAHD
jgi:hypothetical protein